MVAGRIGRDVRLKLNRRSFGVRDDSETGGIGAKETEKIGAQNNEPKKKRNDALEKRGSKTKDTGTTGRERKNDERRKSLYVADVGAVIEEFPKNAKT